MGGEDDVTLINIQYRLHIPEGDGCFFSGQEDENDMVSIRYPCRGVPRYSTIQ